MSKSRNIALTSSSSCYSSSSFSSSYKSSHLAVHPLCWMNPVLMTFLFTSVSSYKVQMAAPMYAVIFSLAIFFFTFHFMAAILLICISIYYLEYMPNPDPSPFSFFHFLYDIFHPSFLQLKCFILNHQVLAIYLEVYTTEILDLA